jgi:sphingomyelin phosphodiesterase 2
VNGYVHKIQHGDWFGGKGVGMCKINVHGSLVHLYAAHLHAEYNRHCDDYMAHRTIQAFDTAEFIESTRGNSVLQVLAGDLNTEPGDLAYRVLLSTSRMIDTYDKTYPNHGTNECAGNSYTEEKVAKKAPDGKRIDYIMYRLGDHYDGKLLEYSLPLPSRIPQSDCSYSDHEAVHSKIILKKISASHGHFSCQKIEDGIIETDANDNILALRESILICNDSLKKLDSDRRNYWLMAIAVIVVLFNMIEMTAPYGLKTAFLLLKFFLCGVIIFFIFMATIWNIVERHGILSGKLAMEYALRNLEDQKGDEEPTCEPSARLD